LAGVTLAWRLLFQSETIPGWRLLWHPRQYCVARLGSAARAEPVRKGNKKSASRKNAAVHWKADNVLGIAVLLVSDGEGSGQVEA
jgi:hypothetical protein